MIVWKLSWIKKQLAHGYFEPLSTKKDQYHFLKEESYWYSTPSLFHFPLFQHTSFYKADDY